MMTKLTNEQLEAIRKRTEAATPYDEEWKPIEGTDGNYEVSNMGNVRSRLKPGNHRNKIGNPRNLKLRVGSAGYFDVSLPLGDDGKYVTKRVHGLVAQAFLGKRPEGYETAHLNGVKTDNRADNLKYVTPRENEAHKETHGTAPIGEANGQSKLLGWQVEIMKYLVSKGVPQAKIVDLFEVSRDTVSSIIIGESWSHIKPHEDIPKLLAEIERLRNELSEVLEYNRYYFDLCKERKREIDRLEDGYERRARRLTDLQEECDRLESFLQEIDTHIRSTPDALPYIIGTMRKFWFYREGYSDDQTE